MAETAGTQSICMSNPFFCPFNVTSLLTNIPRFYITHRIRIKSLVQLRFPTVSMSLYICPIYSSCNPLYWYPNIHTHLFLLPLLRPFYLLIPKPPTFKSYILVLIQLNSCLSSLPFQIPCHPLPKNLFELNLSHEWGNAYKESHCLHLILIEIYILTFRYKERGSEALSPVHFQISPCTQQTLNEYCWMRDGKRDGNQECCFILVSVFVLLAQLVRTQFKCELHQGGNLV